MACSVVEICFSLTLHDNEKSICVALLRHHLCVSLLHYNKHTLVSGQDLNVGGHQLEEGSVKHVVLLNGWLEYVMSMNV